ncbi:MAG: hypothetical protein WBW33_06290, partial [Bryobacteraceae bacterium]
LLESGHHGNLWLDLELLCSRPGRLKPLIAELSNRLSRLEVEAVCGALVEGAFIGLLTASQMGVDFAYSERYEQKGEGGLFPVGYRVPDSLRSSVRQRRVAIVNDVINAGSAVRGTFDDLQACGSTVVAVGALLVLGASAQEFASRKGIALESIAAMPNELWAESTCPLCASGIALEDVAGFRTEWG